jgi:hypothetical protein
VGPSNLTAGSTEWYTFTASAGNTYSVGWNDYDNYAGFYCNIKVSVYDSAGYPIRENVDTVTPPNTITIPGLIGDIYVKVEGYDSFSFGGYNIWYNN